MKEVLHFITGKDFKVYDYLVFLFSDVPPRRDTGVIYGEIGGSMFFKVVKSVMEILKSKN